MALSQKKYPRAVDLNGAGREVTQAASRQLRWLRPYEPQ